MPDTKKVKWIDNYTDESSSSNDPETAMPPTTPAANDADGWQQYRRWISKAPAPRARRGGMDPSLYTWKGYRSWSEKVKRNWSDDDDSK
ncbi:MAG TPA: hypothetical protein PKK10_16855 [Woeseiaceae bacterium]|nr:hypothetical protein [Woeseiaceae bacterium]